MKLLKGNQDPQIYILPIVFLFFRLILFSSSPFPIVPGYGDYWNFFNQAGLGIPFIDYWTEFPPLFPIISKLIFIASQGNETSFSYGLAFLLSFVQALTIGLFLLINKNIRPSLSNNNRGWFYLIFTAGLFYTWSYFDSLAVFFMLLGIYWLTEKKDISAAFAIALGILTKWFPVLILPGLWKIRKKENALKISIISLGIVILVWVGMLWGSPEMTEASLLSQGEKGSWETVWALFDGNLQTGNFNPLIDRSSPSTIYIPSGNPSVVPVWLTLVLFGSFGLYLLVKSKKADNLWLISFTGLAYIILFLWSPGYSPQWVLYLLPLILLSLPENEAYLFSGLLILINILEWPILLSRGQFSSLYYLIPLRSLVMIALGVRFYLISSEIIDLQKG